MSTVSRLYLLFCWAVVIFILISAPMPEYVSDKTTFYDKGVHVILFGILAYLIVYALGGDKNKRLGLIFSTSFFISILYSGLSEYLQIFIPGRVFFLIIFSHPIFSPSVIYISRVKYTLPINKTVDCF